MASRTNMNPAKELRRKILGLWDLYFVLVGCVFGLDPCPFPCTQGGQNYCHHIPCPLPPCQDPVLTPGECCPHCPDVLEEEDPCPFPCTYEGRVQCVPIFCFPPACVDHVFKDGECCPSCPNGPNCLASDGDIVPMYQTKIIDGKNCTCTAYVDSYNMIMQCK